MNTENDINKDKKTVEAFNRPSIVETLEDISTLEPKALEVATTTKTSENIGQLALALAKAQGDIQAAHKDSENPFFKSSYADLNSVWDACRAALSKNELAIVQCPEAAGKGSGAIQVVTYLTHSSGEYICSTLAIPLAKKDAHGVGSAITYARRYALSSMVGVSPSDDDANAAVSVNRK
jgi:hypothetical protein